MVERCIDYCIAIIYQRAGGKHIETEIPFALKRRVRFLRRCFQRLEPLAPFRPDAIKLLNRVESLTDTRHMLVHGCLSSILPQGEDHQFVFVKIDLTENKQLHVSNSLTTSGRQLRQDIGEAFALATDLTGFVERLLEAVVPEHKTNNLFRSVRGQ